MSVGAGLGRDGAGNLKRVGDAFREVGSFQTRHSVLSAATCVSRYGVFTAPRANRNCAAKVSLP